MRIQYTHNKKPYTVVGDTLFACINQIQDNEAREFCRKHLPTNVSSETFSRIMADSFDWRGVRITQDTPAQAA